MKWCNQAILGGHLAGFDLDDMIQEANMAGLEAIKWYKPGRGFQFSTYLKRCVWNRLSKWRDDRRQRPLPQEGKDEDLDLCEAVQAVDKDWLKGIMAGLSPLERQVLELKHGLSGGGALDHQEIGRKLGVNAKTVDALEIGARSKLRKALPQVDE